MWGAEEVQVQKAAYRRLFHFFRLTKALAPFLPGKCDHIASLLNLQTPRCSCKRTQSVSHVQEHIDAETQARLCPAGISIILRTYFHPHNVSKAVSHIEHSAVPMAVPEGGASGWPPTAPPSMPVYEAVSTYILGISAYIANETAAALLGQGRRRRTFAGTRPERGRLSLHGAFMVTVSIGCVWVHRSFTVLAAGWRRIDCGSSV